MTSKPLSDRAGTQSSEVSANDAHAAIAELQAETRELRTLCHHLMAVHEQDHARIARELHDGLGSSLTAVAMDLAWVQHRLDKDSPVATRLERAHAVLSSTVNMKRRVISELRPTILDNLGLAAAIESHVGEFTRATGMAVELDMPFELPELPAGTPITLFRIVQEALDNVVRHARAGQIALSLHVNDDGIILEIRDNGAGIDSLRNTIEFPSFGLLTMRERALQVGAKMAILAGPGNCGTVVRVAIPLPAVSRPPSLVGADMGSGR